MGQPTLDLDILRSFITGIRLGSFAKAAEQLGRSTSAISAQMHKLEEQAGVALFRKAGRGLALTEAGEVLLSYAHRLLDLQDEAVVAVQGTAAEGWLRVGLQEDFGETILPRTLGRFARAHPKIRIEARIGRNGELADLIAAGRLDLALVWDDGNTNRPVRPEQCCPLTTVPVRWIGPREALPPRAPAGTPLPLIAYDDRCWMLLSATARLDQIGQPWRIALRSPNLAGIWAGVAAGLGLTIRTAIGLPADLRVLETDDLPPLPTITIVLLRQKQDGDPLADRLARIITEEVHQLINTATTPKKQAKITIA